MNLPGAASAHVTEIVAGPAHDPTAQPQDGTTHAGTRGGPFEVVEADRAGVHGSTARTGSLAGEGDVLREGLIHVKAAQDGGARTVGPAGVAGEVGGQRLFHGIPQLIPVAGRDQTRLLARA